MDTQTIESMFDKHIVNMRNQTMCYVTSEKFIQSFNQPITTHIVYDFDEFISLIEPGYVYNIELHFTTPKLPKPLKGLNTKGVLTHVLRHPDELRVFTHAFNLVVTENEMYHGQSWCRLQKYRYSLIEFKEQWFETLGNVIQKFLSHPYELFAFFGVSKGDLTRICDGKSMNRVLEAIQHLPLTTKYVVQKS